VGGYQYIAVESPVDRVMLLHAAGHSMAYINGEPRYGDPYGYNYTLLPVHLRAGINHLLVQCSRGSFQGKLLSPKSPAFLNPADPTLPDLPAGEPVNTWGAVIVGNASTTPTTNLYLEIGLEGRVTLVPVPPLVPLGTRKVNFPLVGRAPATGLSRLTIRLLRDEAGALHELDRAEFPLEVRQPGQSRKITFVSDIDGSVQYYAVQPAIPQADPVDPPALVLSLHGASVEAVGQANAYSPKSWCTIVAPTNRRPYGFDWEDWGRWDALEVLQLAQNEWGTDPRRTYLTGHSMGGHGTWQAGATWPDRFAAIAPSAGWISFWSYAGKDDMDSASPVEALLRRANASSDTLGMRTNYSQQGIYILHGDADDNVPVEQARAMVEHLQGFHHDFRFYEQPGAGHWWDASDEPGADCVDWAPLFDFFARRSLPAPASVREVSFVTMNPEISSSCYWASILAQTVCLASSAIEIRSDPGLQRFKGTTENVQRLSFDMTHLDPAQPVRIELDGTVMADVAVPTGGQPLFLEREGETWRVSGPFDPFQKGPHRYGPFKNAFRHRFVLVYGTRGSAAENEWALAKARFDAETFWYRGNGAVDMVADTAFSLQDFPERSVILYGNAVTNAAWPLLVEESPVQILPGAVQVGATRIEGGGLACLFIQPRRDSHAAAVAVVGGSGLVGMRLTTRCPYFVSGVGYPDCVVLDEKSIQGDASGIRAAGFFGLDWSVDQGDFIYQ
jgi:poly(3-hydroxybutyrate) depolymerase